MIDEQLVGIDEDLQKGESLTCGQQKWLCRHALGLSNQVEALAKTLMWNNPIVRQEDLDRLRNIKAEMGDDTYIYSEEDMVFMVGWVERLLQVIPERAVGA